MATILLKKMVTKNIVKGKIIDAVKGHADGTVVPLYTVFGQATSYKSGESNYGPWNVFNGTFEAVSAQDGDIYRSSKVFIPDPMENMLIKALNDGAALVEFGLVVSAKKRDDLDRGYEYIISPTIEVSTSDTLSNIRAIALSDGMVIPPLLESDDEKEDVEKEAEVVENEPSKKPAKKTAK